MTIIQAGVLGIIQGLTEFLPVSSSGHLIFLPKLFGWADQGVAFDTIIHLGTLLALLIYFRSKLWKIVKSYFNSEAEEMKKLGNLIILSVIPAAVIGFFFGDWLENTFRSVEVVAFNMIFWGIILYFAEVWNKKLAVKDLNSLGWQKSLFIGCAQVLALIPGTSRSGITMTAGLFSKLNRESAAEFSFLMSAPIIALAGMDGLLKIIKHGVENISIAPLLIGFLASAVSGLLAVWGLLKIIKRYSFRPFVVYRILIGIAIILFLL